MGSGGVEGGIPYLVVCWGQLLPRRRLPAGRARVGAVVTVTVTEAQSEKPPAENEHHQAAANCQLSHTELREILILITDHCTGWENGALDIPRFPLFPADVTLHSQSREL